jgi:hypothetical protein
MLLYDRTFSQARQGSPSERADAASFYHVVVKGKAGPRNIIDRNHAAEPFRAVLRFGQTEFLQQFRPEHGAV